MVKIALTSTEEAFLKLVTDQHAHDIQAADARKNERVGILLRDKGIPPDVPVGAEARQGDKPAYLTYDTVQADDGRMVFETTTQPE